MVTTFLILSLVQAEEVEVASVTFSLQDQTFAETLSLELSCETEGVVIRYSTDGNPPSLFNATVYTGPIEIVDTTWVRAEATLAGSRYSSGVTSGHYIRLAPDVQGFESPLPILVLENFGQGKIPSKVWNQTGAGVKQVARQRAQWFLFDRSDSGVSRLGDAPDESARLGVRVRGAFSSSFPRKPFSVEAWDEGDSEMAIEPLGMPAESDWILYPPNAAQDQTLLYNTWLYALSRSLGGNAVRFRFTEAFVHTGGGSLSMADHAGVYVLMEKVKRDEARLDFPKLSEDGTEGGWLLSINRMDPIPVKGYPTANGATEPQFFHTAGPDRILQTSPNQAGRGDDIPRQSNAFINFESPNGYEINEAQRGAIEGWFTTFEDVLYGADFTDPVDGYGRYLDVDNFIDYYLLHDLTRNTDGLLISMWVYKEGPEAKLKMGPVWDYDLAYRSTATSDLGLNRNRLWYGRLWQDREFEQRYIDRWQALRAGPLSHDGIHALIDQQAAEITVAAKALAKALDVRGLMNIQFAVKDDDLYVIEVNPRASRTVPFVSKATGIQLAKLAAKIMAGKTLKELGFTEEVMPTHYSVKEAVFPFIKFPGTDITLSPEMKSTGEVMGIDSNLGMAYAKSQMSASSALPMAGNVFISVSDRHKPQIAEIARGFHDLGFKIFATDGTGKVFEDTPFTTLPKLHEGRPNVLDMIKNGEIQLIINTPDDRETKADAVTIRSVATSNRIPIITTLSGTKASLEAIRCLQSQEMTVVPLQDYH